MSTETHIEHLNLKHEELEEALHEESHRPAPDTSRLALLKREKLKIKDEIQRLSPH